MTKNNNESSDILNIGLVGHIDHGKTTLLQKLSGKWTDTHSEELKRGITIKLGYAECSLFKSDNEYNISGNGKKIRDLSFVDAPGHEMLMATMLSGAALIDVALLLIAANEGIKPQTREHLMALQAKGIRNIIVIQNKIDLIDKKDAEKNYKEIKDFLKGRYDEAPIIPISAQQGTNIDVIWKMLAEIETPKRNLKGDPLFLIARSFDINKPGAKPEELKGAVLGGTLKKGILKKGDEIEIKPGRLIKENNQFRFNTISTKIIGLYRGSRSLTELNPGGSTSIETELDMTLGKGDILQGNIVSLTGKLPDLIDSIDIEYKLFEKDGVGNKIIELKKGEIILLSIDTSATGGAITKIVGEKISIDLKKPVVAFKDDNVGIARNINGHWRLIGSGRII